MQKAPRENLLEVENWHFMTHASTLGLSNWPRLLETDIGNKEPFELG
jgi:hypothetical protein